MKVILLQDVAKIGRRGEITEVPNGYAMNQLIPQKKATPATGANLKKAQRAASLSAAHVKHTEESFAAAVEKLSAHPPTIVATMNDQDHMFEAVHPEMIVSAAANIGATITSDMIQIEQPIKSAGEHTVQLVSGNQKAPFTIVVTKAE